MTVDIKELRRWQDSYKLEIHGAVEDNEWLDEEVFINGGIRGHIAPRCFLCDPEVDDDNDS